MKRRQFVLTVLAASVPALYSAFAAEDFVTVYKSPT